MQRLQKLQVCIPPPHQHLPAPQVGKGGGGGTEVALAAGRRVGDKVGARGHHLHTLEPGTHKEGLRGGGWVGGLCNVLLLAWESGEAAE